jgi:F-type H+-transporting ATPase subunit gamma
MQRKKQNDSIYKENTSSNVVNIIIITGDKGLCGSFNNNLIREAKKFINKINKNLRNIQIISIGKKGYQNLKKQSNINILNSYSVSECTNMEFSNRMSKSLYSNYMNSHINSLWVINNDFKSVAKQIIAFDKIVPFKKQAVYTFKNKEYNYEPSKKKLLEVLLPQYFSAYIYQKILESSTSEHASRMQAMENASKNAKETFDILKVQYNRIRQSNITSELIEIISGAEALQ